MCECTGYDLELLLLLVFVSVSVSVFVLVSVSVSVSVFVSVLECPPDRQQLPFWDAQLFYPSPQLRPKRGRRRRISDDWVSNPTGGTSLFRGVGGVCLVLEVSVVDSDL